MEQSNNLKHLFYNEIESVINTSKARLFNVSARNKTPEVDIKNI